MLGRRELVEVEKVDPLAGEPKGGRARRLPDRAPEGLGRRRRVKHARKFHEIIIAAWRGNDVTQQRKYATIKVLHEKNKSGG